MLYNTKASAQLTSMAIPVDSFYILLCLKAFFLRFVIELKCRNVLDTNNNNNVADF